MIDKHPVITRRGIIGGALLFLWLALLVWRLRLPAPGAETRGAVVWLEIAWLLLVYVYILFAGIGFGRLVVRKLSPPQFTRFELCILELLMGISVLSLGIAGLGIIGWMKPWVILCWLGLSGLVSLREWNKPDAPRLVMKLPRARSPYLILLQLISLAVFALVLIECMTPVWDYDALLYHLEVPRQFLAQGRIAFDPEVLRSAYPYHGEMLFVVGLVFDLIPLSKLINFTYAILFGLSCYVFSRRFFGRQTAYTAIGILVGAPAFLAWASWASVDYAWAVFEFWSIYSIMMWLDGKKKDASRWMILAGIMSGLAIGVKYLSLPTMAIVALLILWKSVENENKPIQSALRNLMIFAGFAFIAGGMWYVRNSVVTGNPIYPLLFGGPGWEPLEAQVLNDYVGSFGLGKTWLDYLLLPYNVYVHHNHFSTIGIELIHPILWLALAFPLVKKTTRRYPILLTYAGAVLAVWVITSQVVRFLLPLTAILAVLSGSVIESLGSSVKKILKIGMVGGFMLYNLVFQLQWLQDRDVLKYLGGRHSAAEFLESMSYEYETIRFLREALGADQKAQLLWDGRGFYCDSYCIPDDEQSGAILMTVGDPPPAVLAADLREQGITHLVLSEPDVRWFMVYHDPRGMHRDALAYFEGQFFPTCGKLVHQDSARRVYEITCP